MRINLDSQETLRLDRKLIRKKGFLNRVYQDFYEIFKVSAFPKGPVVELGSGAGFLKKIIPGVITSDTVGGPQIDKVFSATKIPFANNSVAAFFMLDVLHHIKDPEKALQEMERCLKIGGKIVMIEPYNSLWGGLVYKYFHYEKFDPRANWHVEGKGRMSDSNTALPWIIFVRDRKVFEEKFPRLRIVKVNPHTPFLYLLTGGLSKPQLFPTILYPFFKSVESLLTPLNHWIGIFTTIELEKI